MKIDKIELRNLASIEGTQTVDFNAEPLRSASLFAITGETGAGKSTLLDAVCLALYGNAPRFESRERLKRLDGRSGKPDNELVPFDTRNILRRGTKEGYAEVTFTALDGATYQARWAVRVKRTGSYDRAVRTLAQIKPKQRQFDAQEVDEAIRRLVGLDYTQFTRTVLLAQNSFANFLQARQNEKSALLEKITGTDKFARIGARIYQMMRDAEAKTLEQQSLLKGMNVNLLDDVALREAQEQQRLLGSQAKNAEAALAATQAQIKWCADYRQALADNAAAIARRNSCQKALFAVEEQSKLLRRYDSVLPFQPLFNEIEVTKSQISQNRAQQAALQRDIEAKRQAVAAAASAKEQAQSRLDEAKRLLEQRQPQLDRGNQIQGELKAAADELDKAAAESNKLGKRRDVRRDTCRQKEAELAESEKLIAACEHKQQTYAVHQKMLDKTDVVTEKLARMSEATGELKKLRVAQRRDQEQKVGMKKSNVDLLALNQKIEQKISSLRSSLEVHRLANYGRDGEELQQRVISLNSHLEQLQGARDLWQRLSDKFTQQEELDAEISRRASSLVHDEEALQRLEGEVKALAEEHGRRQQSYLFSNSSNIVSLRKQLKEGSACPVCGATHHPYHTETEQELGNLLDNLEKDYVESKKRLEARTAERDKLRSRVAADEATLKARREAMGQLSSEVADDTRLWQKYSQLNSTFGECSPEINRNGRRMMIEQLLDTAGKDAAAAASQANDFQSHQRQINEINKQIEGQQALLNQNADHLSDQKAAIKAIDTRLDTTQQRIQHVDALAGQLYEELDRLITLQSWYSQWEANPENFRQRLMNMKADYDRNGQQLAQEQQSRQLLAEAVSAARQSLQEAEAQLQQTADEMSKTTALIESKKSELRAIFGDRQPSDVARQLSGDVSSAQALADSAQKTLAELQGQLNVEEGRNRGLDEQHRAALASLSGLQSKLDEGIHLFNSQHSPLQYAELERIFGDSRDWNALRSRLAALSEQALLANEQADKAQARVVALQGADSCPEGGLSGGDELEEGLRAAAERGQQSLKDLQSQLSDVEHRLRMHAETIERTRDLHDSIARLSERLDNWKKLCELLGDAAGSKFRDQAQNFTFEFLVADANEQLRQLTSRYRLSHVPGTLSLEIIDRDMFDERRPVNSLSGGETFIVSLALALALADISSANLNIGSLFIDEGFGNLDSESLQMVMDALGSLQNTQGRKVGVISHTDSIREHIHPQICVVKQPAGGKSSIKVVS